MSNNILQKKTITQMAKRSLQSGKIRNIFVMVTIILSVSLLTAIFMFGAGAQEEKRRQAAEASHAVFGNLTQEISAKLKEDDRLSYTVEAKQGIPTEMDGYNVIPRYIEELSSEINMGKLLACVLVIYGVFYISVVGRIHQFGQMRTIGMTRKQIRKFVKKEGTALFVRAFPIGLFLGGIAGYFIKPQGFSLKNTLFIFAAVVLINYLITMLSVVKPAKIAADISPMEALRYTHQDGMKKSSGAKKCRNLSAFGMGL